MKVDLGSLLVKNMWKTARMSCLFCPGQFVWRMDLQPSDVVSGQAAGFLLWSLLGVCCGVDGLEVMELVEDI